MGMGLAVPEADTPFWYGDMSADFSRYANLGDIKLKEFAACTAYKFYESAMVIENPINTTTGFRATRLTTTEVSSPNR